MGGGGAEERLESPDRDMTGGLLLVGMGGDMGCCCCCCCLAKPAELGAGRGGGAPRPKFVAMGGGA